MSYNTVTQRGATRNFSTADYDHRVICIGDNQFLEGDFKNTSGASLNLTPGMLAARSATIVDGFIPVTVDNLADVIGVCVQEGVITMANNAIVHINLVVTGKIDGTVLVLPATVTLDTMVGNKALKDVINSLGLHIDQSAVQNTKFDN